MNYMTVFLIIFTIVSVVHIIVTALQKEWPQRVSKVLIIPFLLAAYIAGRGSQDILIILALVFGWIGDILLIKKKKRIIFKLGILSFLMGHLCYIAAFINYLGTLGFLSAFIWLINIRTLVAIIPLGIIAGIFVYRLIKPLKEMIIFVIIYMIVIEAMAFWGLHIFILVSGFASFMIFLGCLLFMISDSTLAYYAFRKIKVFASVMIMVLYILAQTGIVMGFLLLK